MNKLYFKAENETEARIIVGTLGVQYGLNPWQEHLYDFSYPLFIGHVNGDTFPQATSESNWETEGYVSGGGIAGLFALAKNGFKTPRWIPEIGKRYCVPSVAARGSFITAYWGDTPWDNIRLERNAVCRTPEEAVAKRDLMLAAIAGEDEGD